MLSPNGSYRLFAFRGITVFVHWSWFVAAYMLYQFSGLRDPLAFLAVYVSLFGIVLLHEFGHSLACRSVGGKADNIVLWPLGGVAFVAPPPRPWPTLWSIAAGPLVNVALLPVFYGAYFILRGSLYQHPTTPFESYLYILAHINLGLLIFNMMPIYPLDGGQIVQSILWLFVGRGKSLQVTAGIGFVVAAIAFVLALIGRSDFIPVSRTMLLLLSAFVAWQAWNGYRVAKVFSKMEAHEADSIQRAMQRARDMTRGGS